MKVNFRHAEFVLTVWAKPFHSMSNRQYWKMFNLSNFTGNDLAKEHSSSVRYFSCSETIVFINCALNVPLIIISILGNSIVLAAILNTPSLRSPPSMLFLTSLAVSDLLVGLVIQPLYIVSGLVRNHLLDTTWFMLSFATCGISLFSLTAISVDRFLAVHYHLRYPSIVTSFRAKFTIAITWLTIFLLSGMYFWSKHGYFLLIALGVCLCLKISIYSYIRIFRIVRHQQVQIYCQQQAVSSQLNNVSSMLMLKRSAFNSFVFFIVMIIFYFPMCVAMSLHVITYDWQRAWSFATTAVFMNSSVNPFLYCWRLRELRTAVGKTLRKMCCK